MVSGQAWVWVLQVVVHHDPTGIPGLAGGGVGVRVREVPPFPPTPVLINNESVSQSACVCGYSYADTGYLYRSPKHIYAPGDMYSPANGEILYITYDTTHP